MKKFLFFAATAAIALASCSEQVDFTQESLQTQNDGPTPVQFGTYLGSSATTRALTQSYTKGTIGNADATVRGLTDLKKAQFGVFAYSTGAKDYRGYTSGSGSYPFDWTNASAAGKWKKDDTNKYPNFMYNEKIYWSGNTADASGAQWVYDVVKYWPNGIDAANSSTPSTTAKQEQEGKVSFFAYAPYMEEASATEVTGGPTGVTAYQVKTPFTYTPSGGSATNNGIVAISKNTSPTNVWVKYVMPSANVADAVDLLWGLSGKNTYKEADNTNPTLTIGDSYNENLTKQIVKESSTEERVKFIFKHALSKVGGATTSDESESTTGSPAQCGFKIVVDVDKNSDSPSTQGQSDQTTYFPSNDFATSKTLVTVKEVKIQDGKSASDDINITQVTGLESNLNNAGWFNIEEGLWSNGTVEGGAGATYKIVANNDATLDNDTYRLNEAILEIGAGKSDATGPVKKLKDATGAEWSTDNPVGVSTTATPLFANENIPGLLLIPGGTGNDIYVTVDYFVRTADPKLALGYSEVEQVITNKVSLANLQPNKYYTIIIHLGLTSVKFEAVVAEWSTKDGDTYKTDGTIDTAGSTEETEVIWLPSNVVK